MKEIEKKTRKVKRGTVTIESRLTRSHEQHIVDSEFIIIKLFFVDFLFFLTIWTHRRAFDSTLIFFFL